MLDPGMNIYLKRIGRKKLLTKNQEIKLSKLIERGREPGDPLAIKGHKPSKEDIRLAEKARKEMIECNLRLVVSIAKKYVNRGCDLDDLIETGNIGLMKAVERFDYRRGFRFSTYGSWWIKQAIGREIASQSKSIRVPGRAINVTKELEDARNEFIDLNGQEPTRAELAEILGVTETTIGSALEGTPAVVSLDDVIGRNEDGEKLVKDTISDNTEMSPFNVINRQDFEKITRSVLETLPPREELILRMRFGIGEDPSDHKNFPITEKEKLALEKS